MKPTPNKNRTKLPHEVFQLCEEAKTVAERVKILQENGTFGIKTVLQVNYKEEVVFDLPEGDPPFRVSDQVAGQSMRHFEKMVRELAHLIVQSPLPRYKKEVKFIRLLESVCEEDAKILLAIREKKLKKLYKTLTESTVRKAFPTILPPPAPKK